jgi:hypothetical protein
MEPVPLFAKRQKYLATDSAKAGCAKVTVQIGDSNTTSGSHLTAEELSGSGAHESFFRREPLFPNKFQGFKSPWSHLQNPKVDQPKVTSRHTSSSERRFPCKVRSRGSMLSERRSALLLAIIPLTVSAFAPAPGLARLRGTTGRITPIQPCNAFRFAKPRVER